MGLLDFVPRPLVPAGGTGARRPAPLAGGPVALAGGAELEQPPPRARAIPPPGFAAYRSEGVTAADVQALPWRLAPPGARGFPSAVPARGGSVPSQLQGNVLVPDYLSAQGRQVAAGMWWPEA